jgi:hypothetical protein
MDTARLQQQEIKEIRREQDEEAKGIQKLEEDLKSVGGSPKSHFELEVRRLKHQRLKESIPRSIRVPGLDIQHHFFPDDSSSIPAYVNLPPSPPASPAHRPPVNPAHQDEKIDETHPDYIKALDVLRNQQNYHQKAFKHFEYDLHQKAFKERRPISRVFSYPPVNVAPGVYQIGGVQSVEEVYLKPQYRDIETIQRTDTYDRAHKFNQANRRKSGMEGRAYSYLTVGPWIKLRFLKQTIHITLKGRPPQKAYDILARHLNAQIKQADRPRIVQPRRETKSKTYMETVASTERLKNISGAELSTILGRALRKRVKHIIYRQSSIGGPFFKYAKTHESLY